MTRGIDATTQARLAAPSVQMLTLIEMQFRSGTMYVAGASADVTWDGKVWMATHGLITIDDVEETGTEVKGIALTLTGVPPDKISLGLSENVYGRPLIVRNLFVGEDGSLSADAGVWSGYMDALFIQETATTATVRVTAEHRMAIWNRPRVVRFSPEDQALVDSDDRFFQYAASLSQKPIVWPNKEFFRQ